MFFINRTPFGLEDVSKYPNLFAEMLLDPSWSEEDLKKLAGHNLLRVLRQVEKVYIYIYYNSEENVLTVLCNIRFVTIFNDLIHCLKKPPFLTMICGGKLTASIRREALHLKLRLLPSNRHFITLPDSSKEMAQTDSIDVFNLSLQIVSPRTHSTRKSGAYSGVARSNNHPISLCLYCSGNEHFRDPISHSYLYIFH